MQVFFSHFMHMLILTCLQVAHLFAQHAVLHFLLPLFYLSSLPSCFVIVPFLLFSKLFTASLLVSQFQLETFHSLNLLTRFC